MTLLAVFGIGMMEIICLLGGVAVVGVVIVGVLVALAATNRSKDDRRE